MTNLDFVNYLKIMVFAIVGMVTGCSSSDDAVDIPEIKINVSDLSFENSGGVNKFSISGATQVLATSDDPSWCKVQTESSLGVSKLTTVVVNVSENKSSESRSTQLHIKADATTKDIRVTQEGTKVDKPVPEPEPANDAVALSRKLGLGWNLGNQMDAHANGVANETCWGNGLATQATFDKLAQVGVTTVRIPITWLGKVGAAPDYTIDEAWLNRVAELVGFAKKAGLNVVINIHHDGADSAHWLDIKGAATNEEKNQAVQAQVAAMWTQIAQKFKDEGDYLIFESFNEIHDGGWGWGDNRKDGGKQYAVLNQWNQVFVDAVRAVGGENSMRYLAVPGYCTNPDLTIEQLQLPDDSANNRLIVAVHFYDPYEYTLNAKFSEWGHTGKDKESWGDESNVTNIFGKLKTAFVDKNIPVYIGEMGCVHRSNERAEAFRKYYLEYVCKAAIDHGMAPIYWDNGSADSGRECSGLINHANGNFLNNGEEVFEVMTRAVFTQTASYTLKSVYDSAPK
ncbi:MAG: cellulase family glycosylhydrolase [Bacteroides sp.]|nr:cellulase family glycosylhydrolase [Bacteroides sp.]